MLWETLQEMDFCKYLIREVMVDLVEKVATAVAVELANKAVVQRRIGLSYLSKERLLLDARAVPVTEATEAMGVMGELEDKEDGEEMEIW